MQQNPINAIRCNIAHPENGAAARYLTLHSVHEEADHILTEWNAYVSCRRAKEGYEPLFRFRLAVSKTERTDETDWAYRSLLSSGKVPGAEAVFDTVP